LEKTPPPEHPVEDASTTEGLPVAPGMGAALASVQAPRESVAVGPRVILIAAIAIGIGIAAALVAVFLTRLIGLVTNAAYYGRLSTEFSAPSIERLGAWSVLVPVAGAIIVGIMARYGSAAIRGHGIPEVMERVLYGKSRISPRVMFLKPLSAAIAIGTGGPFGAEGPIIATGGALGSIVGQVFHVTADERKTLLAAGAAAGMTATFGTPVSAVLLAVELLLFEYRARSLVPVALASAAATAARMALVGSAPVFTLPDVGQPGAEALAFYVLLGIGIGVVSVGITRFVYGIEDLFDKLPIHWMWWPALGAVVVGVVGLLEPRTLGVGYTNIDAILSGGIIGRALLVLIVLKFISWSIYLGSGTSGGTLAPLFTIGGGIGALAGAAATSIGVDVHVAALVGMASIFAGASHALLASVVFAFETTRQPLGLLPLLAGCSAAYLTSHLMMRHSIMTEKLARRGTAVRTEYSMDFLSQVRVGDAMKREVAALGGDETLASVREKLEGDTGGVMPKGFPVVDANGMLMGVVTRRDIFSREHPGTHLVRHAIRRSPAVAYPDNTLREAADHMVRERVGRLPVVERDAPRNVIGIISRGDLLRAHEPRLAAAHLTETGAIRIIRRRRTRPAR
jgi:CIC family chloride channel protein